MEAIDVAVRESQAFKSRVTDLRLSLVGNHWQEFRAAMLYIAEQALLKGYGVPYSKDSGNEGLQKLSAFYRTAGLYPKAGVSDESQAKADAAALLKELQAKFPEIQQPVEQQGRLR
jgi:hypothetical protein